MFLSITPKIKGTIVRTVRNMTTFFVSNHKCLGDSNRHFKYLYNSCNMPKCLSLHRKCWKWNCYREILKSSYVWNFSTLAKLHQHPNLIVEPLPYSHRVTFFLSRYTLKHWEMIGSLRSFLEDFESITKVGIIRTKQIRNTHWMSD